MGKKEKGSKLLKALGKTKKEQMAKLYPKVKGNIRGKGPYVRGTIGKKGAGDFLKRRTAVAGTKFPTPTKKRSMSAGEMAAHVIGAGATGWAIGSGQHKKAWGSIKKHLTKKKEDTHLDKARRGAKELIKKQKTKKEKSKRHH